MAFTSTQTAHILALVKIYDCYGTGKQKTVENAAIQKVQLALGKSKAPLSLLNWFNETYNKADYINIYVLACADTHCKWKSSKWIVPTQVFHSIHYPAIY